MRNTKEVKAMKKKFQEIDPSIAHLSRLYFSVRF